MSPLTPPPLPEKPAPKSEVTRIVQEFKNLAIELLNLIARKPTK